MTPFHETNAVLSEVSERIEHRIQSVHFFFFFFFSVICTLAVGGRWRRWVNKMGRRRRSFYLVCLLYILLLNTKCLKYCIAQPIRLHDLGRGKGWLVIVFFFLQVILSFFFFFVWVKTLFIILIFSKIILI